MYKLTTLPCINEIIYDVYLGQACVVGPENPITPRVMMIKKTIVVATGRRTEVSVNAMVTFFRGLRLVGESFSAPEVLLSGGLHAA